jgi:hypothetical protein
VEQLPGPGAYHYVAPPRKGGTISSHVVKSDMDFALERAREQPGPGEYELVPLDRGKSSTMSGRTRGAGDVLISQASRRPGPGEYELPRARVRGGVFTVDTKRQISSLPAIAPGPGAYMQTPTIKQEREMRQLSKQVVRLVKNRQVLGGSAPGEVRSLMGGTRSSGLLLEALDE